MGERSKIYAGALALSTALHGLIFALPFSAGRAEIERPLLMLKLVSTSVPVTAGSSDGESSSAAFSPIQAPPVQPRPEKKENAKTAPHKAVSAQALPKVKPKTVIPQKKTRREVREKTVHQVPPQNSSLPARGQSLPGEARGGGGGREGGSGRGGDGIQSAVRAVLLKKVEPLYPRASRIRGEEGLVTLIVTVKSGAVTGVAVEKSSGFAALDASAVRALKGWRFIKSLSARVRVPVRFSLKGISMEL